MAKPVAGTQFTVLGAGDPLTDSELRRRYAYPDDLQRCWVRSNFVSSLDGGATADGRSGGLGGDGDRAIFAMLRELADVVVVGAGTVRAENYGGARPAATARRARRDAGQAEVPPIAIVTRSGELAGDARVFTATEVPPLVLTVRSAVDTTGERLGRAAEVLDCSGADPGEVDLSVALDLLAGRGLRRVLTEGGPMLHGTLMQDGLLDELCLTIAPVLVGGAARRIAASPTGFLTAAHPVHVLTDETGYLYTRYTTG